MEEVTPKEVKRINLYNVLERIESKLIIRALEATEYNKTKAAELLGIGRSNLSMRIRRLSKVAHLAGRSGEVKLRLELMELREKIRTGELVENKSLEQET